MYLVTQIGVTHGITNWIVENKGIAGQGLNFSYDGVQLPLLTDAPPHVDYYLGWYDTVYLIAFMGTNDIFLNGTSGSSTGVLMQQYISDRISAGWNPGKIVVCTMLPRQLQHESDRTAYNNSIRANAGSVGYLVADLAADPNIGPAGSETNTTYYADEIHPTDAGHQVIANIIGAVLFP